MDLFEKASGRSEIRIRRGTHSGELVRVLASTLNYSKRISASDQHVLGRPELDARKAQLAVWVSDVADSKSDAEHDELVQQRIYERAVAEHVGIGGARFVAAESGEQRIPGGEFQRVRDELRQRGDGAAGNGRGSECAIQLRARRKRIGAGSAGGAALRGRWISRCTCRMCGR